LPLRRRPKSSQKSNRRAAVPYTTKTENRSPFKRLFITLLIDQGRKGLIEFVESLESGEDIGGMLKAMTHGTTHFRLLEAALADKP